MNPILILDMFNIFTRFFCASPYMDAHGDPSGGIIGTLKSLSNMTRTMNPSKIICCWESNGSARRKMIYPEYKAGRKPPRINNIYDNIEYTEENKWKQVGILTKLLKYLPVYQIHIDNAEADDVIGYLCGLKYQNDKKIIVSSDKDYYQLLNNTTVIYNSSKMEFINKNDVVKEYNISVDNFCLAKAVCGDDSDNIDGVHGIGFKTLSKRFVLNENKISIDELITEADRLKDNKKAAKAYGDIVNSVDKIKRNYKLMKLDSSFLSSDQIVSINRILDEYKFKNNKLKFLQTYLESSLNGLDPDVVYGIFGYLYYLNQ